MALEKNFSCKNKFQDHLFAKANVLIHFKVWLFWSRCTEDIYHLQKDIFVILKNVLQGSSGLEFVDASMLVRTPITIQHRKAHCVRITRFTAESL